MKDSLRAFFENRARKIQKRILQIQSPSVFHADKTKMYRTSIALILIFTLITIGHSRPYDSEKVKINFLKLFFKYKIKLGIFTTRESDCQDRNAKSTSC